MLDYGDAVAHLHIARRIFDSHFPGLRQLGSVWLPLPHLLLIPFVAKYSWWANGFAAVIPSSLAWLASCYGLYRLARHWLQPVPAAIALAFFAANPNLLYLQTTAMTEPLFVCEMIWTAVWLVEWRGIMDTDPARSTGLLFRIALVLAAAVYTRYDGWIMALLAWTAIGIVLLRRGRLANRGFWLASLIVLAAPVIWFVYNAAVFGDWLDFMRGPYSAKAIELRTALPGGPPHPGWHDMRTAFLFFMKCAEIDAAARGWNNPMLIVSLIGVAWAGLIARKQAFYWSLLLWIPAPFYAYSVAYGSVPIFLPVWWPHSYYNLRYGLELLPALALGLALTANLLLTATGEFLPRWTKPVAAACFALIAINTVRMVAQQPKVYVEGTKNINSRRPLEQAIPPALRAALAPHPDAPVLMITSVYPDIVAFTGIPLRQTINEGDQDVFSAALADPATHAAVILAFEGDPIDQAVKAHPQGLIAVGRFTAPTQPVGTLYVSTQWHPGEGSE